MMVSVNARRVGGRDEVSQPMEAYQIVGRLKRFDRRNDAFGRARSDADSPAFAMKPLPREEIIASGRAGYALEDIALRAGAAAPDRLLRGQWPGWIEEAPPAAGPCEPDDAARFTDGVKQAARFYGASLAGVARVNPLWLFARDGDGRPVALPEGVTAAVVMAVEMDGELIGTSPAFPASAATWKGYSQMAFTATCLAGYLRELGYRAVPSGNDTALSIPLAIDAGLGELGRGGSLVTRPHGPRVRLCKVFTDAPLVADEPIWFGVREFCERCTKCADACPAGAICRGEMTDAGPTPSNNPGVLKWYADPDKCLAFWRANGTNCSNCISSCPFNRPKSRPGARVAEGGLER